MGVLYQRSITVPANTPQSSPIVENIELRGEVIKRATVFFPSGCFALVRVAVYQGLKQIAPYEEGRWIVGDDEEIELLTRYVLYEQPTTLTLKLWNEDDTFDHTPIFRFWVSNLAEAFPELYITTGVGYAVGMRGGIITL